MSEELNASANRSGGQLFTLNRTGGPVIILHSERSEVTGFINAALML